MILSDKELAAFESDRDIEAEILRGVDEMLAGKYAAKHQVVIPDVVAARHKTGLTQTTFAQLLGVSKRTLQEWEQGRRTPNAAARSLVRIAMKHPEVLRELQV
jgi:putative transcriptional regulator